jgi:hypothetical protein
MLPGFFGYHSCSVLFMEGNNKDLLKIQLNPNFVPEKDKKDEDGGKQQDEDAMSEEDPKVDEDKVEFLSMMNYQATIGLTGIAIREKRVVRLQDSDSWQYYSGDVDNCTSLPQLRTLMIGPMYTRDGQCKGVVQMINKLSGDITDAEMADFSTILPAIA